MVRLFAPLCVLTFGGGCGLFSGASSETPDVGAASTGAQAEDLDASGLAAACVAVQKGILRAMRDDDLPKEQKQAVAFRYALRDLSSSPESTARLKEMAAAGLEQGAWLMARMDDARTQKACKPLVVGLPRPDGGADQSPTEP